MAGNRRFEMNVTAPQLMVALLDPVVVVKVTGRANVACSVQFKTLVNELRQRGYRQFALELSECLIMDSTFLGVLAGLGLKLAEAGAERDGCPVCLIRPNPRIVDLLENLGVNQFFKIIQDPAPSSSRFEGVAALEQAPSREEISRTCLEAHQLLMELNPANVPKFKDVAQFLAEDLKKLQQKG